MTGAEIRVARILMESDHQLSVGLDPVEAIVLVFNAGRKPEADFQSGIRDRIRSPEEHYCIDISVYGAGTTSRGSISNVFTTSLLADALEYGAVERPLGETITTGEKYHRKVYKVSSARVSARRALEGIGSLLASGFDIGVEFESVIDQPTVLLVLAPVLEDIAPFTEFGA